MYVVRTGTVDLMLGNTLLETVAPAASSGSSPWSTRPRAAPRPSPDPGCTLVRVDQGAFDDLVRRVPGLALEVMRVMARRLRRSNPEGA